MKRYPTFFDILAVIGVFVFSSLAAGATVGAVMMLAGASQGVMTAVVYPIPMVCTALFAFFYARGRGEGQMPAIRFALPPRQWGLVLGGVVLMLAVSVVLEPLLALFPIEWIEFLNMQLGRGWLTILTTVVMAPILEELLFRGLLQHSTVNRYGPVAGIVIAAAVFGVIHFIPQQVVNAFALGLVLGWVYYKTRSLTAVILMHAANNGLSYYLMGIGPADATVQDVLPEPWMYYALYAACVLIVVAGAVLISGDLGKNRTAEQ
ncbi:MAG: CPBP family intramembrane metalloprotease [Rikenellaceae bacterium]|jgi:membrane protease YdiL (CAAX protease family)|nr:CPBP family intramembrane metalloprotease [Rikenellaceae bacterium]